MSIIYMYHSRDPATSGQCSSGNGSMISLLDHFCALYGGEWASIHPGGYKTHCGVNYQSLPVAYEAYPDHTWVYLDSKSETTLDEFEHPKDNVVYVVGDDHEGFKGEEFKGPSVRIENRHNDNERESFPIACLIMVICNRWSRRWQ